MPAAGAKGVTSRPVTSLLVGFGLRIEGRDLGMSFATMLDAKESATKLACEGYGKIAIFERLSGRVVEHVSPNPSEA